MKKPRTFTIAALLLISYCAASTLDYHALPGEREVPLPEPPVAATKPQPMTREQVTRLVRYAILVEGLDWDENDVDLMVSLCWRESRFYVGCQNPDSTAYGLWQFLDSTWRPTRIAKTRDPLLQTIAACRYVRARYGDATKAYWHQVRKNYY